MPTISVTEAARNFSDVISRTYYRNETTVLVKGGRPVARIVPVNRAALTGRALSERWTTLPRLGEEDAERLGREIESAKSSLAAPRDPWA